MIKGKEKYKENKNLLLNNIYINLIIHSIIIIKKIIIITINFALFLILQKSIKFELYISIYINQKSYNNKCSIYIYIKLFFYNLIIIKQY